MRFMFLALIFSLNVQSLRKPCFEIRFQKNKVSLTPDRSIIVDIMARNSSKQTIILYGIRSDAILSIFPVAEYCDPDVSGGIVLHVYTKEEEPIYPLRPLIPESLDRRPMPMEKLDSILEEARMQFVKDSIVLPSGGSSTWKMKLNLKDFQLAKGEYFMQLTYFSGNLLENYVSPKHMTGDIAEFGGTVFRGCVKSQMVALVVD